MKTLLFLLLFAPQETPQSTQRDIEKIQAEDLAWRRIDWLNCPLEAIRRSKKENKPIVTWVFLGNPSDERC